MIQWNQTASQKSSITIQLLVLIPTVIPKLQLFKVEAQLRVTFLRLTYKLPNNYFVIARSKIYIIFFSFFTQITEVEITIKSKKEKKREENHASKLFRFILHRFRIPVKRNPALNYRKRQI